MTLNLGNLADEIYEKNIEIAQANAALKEIELQKRELENKLIAAMQEAGTDIVRGSKATTSISEVTRPQLQDAEAFYKFVLRKKALHLFERRIAATAYKEMKESMGNKPVPGVSEFTTTRLNVRKVS